MPPDPSADPVARARAVATLARVALDAIDADQVAARVAALEAVLARGIRRDRYWPGCGTARCGSRTWPGRTPTR